MDKGFVSFICSCTTLTAVIIVFAGLLKNSKPAIIVGQGIGAIALAMNILFLLLYL